MKRCLSTLALLLAIGLTMTSCIGITTIRGSGTVAREQREVGGVTEVELGTIGRLEIRLGDKEELLIEGDDNLLAFIQTSMSGSRLTIKTRGGVTLLTREPMVFHLTVETLDAIVLSGLGSIDLPDNLQVSQLSATISGGGSLTMASLKADKLQVNISGLGDLVVSGGQVVEQDIVISGGGNYSAPELQSDRAEIRLSGLGSTAVRVQENLKVTISGGGLVRYSGNPTVEQTVSGIGRVQHIEE